MQIVRLRPAAAHAPPDQADPEGGERRCCVKAGPNDREAAQEYAAPGDPERTHNTAMVAAREVVHQ